MDTNEQQNASALAAVLTQLAPGITRIFKGLRFLVDQPVIREHYILATSAKPGNIIAAGATNVPLPQEDFSHSLEWPFQVEYIQISVDPQHTYRDFAVRLLDRTFNQEWMKNPVLGANLIEANTRFWRLPSPWIIRPAGGGMQFNIDNLDTVNPLTISVAVHGSLLIPR